MSYWSTTPPRRAHILVIDDNIEELQLLLGALRGFGLVQEPLITRMG